MDHSILATSVSAWLWQNYGKSITGKALGAMRARWDKFNWNQASESYRNRVRQIYGTTHILGVSEPVSLEGIYTDVFILDKPTAFLRYDMQRLLAKARQWDHSQRWAMAAKKLKKSVVKKGSDKSKQSDQGNLDPDVIRRDALTVVSERRKLFILGKPGAGKTTLLKYLTLQSAGERLNRIPIFISLKEYGDSRTELIPFIVRQFEICDFPDAELFILQLLNEGKAIVLFDGLDEVNQEKDARGILVNTLKKFFYQYPDNQYLVTCRIAATDYSFEDFTYVEIADFDNNQIQIFVAKWFKDNHQKCDKFLEDLNNDDNKGLRELASIPLLLILLCLAFDETMTFPLRRVEIYEEAIEALLKKWDASRNIKRDPVYRKLSLGRKRQMLARIAAETFESGAYFIPQKVLEKLISNYLDSLPPADGSEDIDH